MEDVSPILLIDGNFPRPQRFALGREGIGARALVFSQLQRFLGSLEQLLGALKLRRRTLRRTRVLRRLNRLARIAHFLHWYHRAAAQQ